jgi:precorrin-2 dehydrogenase/sirohydrochlorin ferrochelatase
MNRYSSSYYPVFLNIRGKKCVVVGGGEVALRKVKALLDAGADVKVISPVLCLELTNLAETKIIFIEKRLFQPGDLEGAFLTVTAVDNNRDNLEVANEARRTGVLVNVVDDPSNSDFIVPSCLRRGEVTIAISTAGRSPALARKIRSRLEDYFGDEYAALALLVDEVRMEIRGRGIKVNGEDWQKALDLDLLINLLKNNDREKAKNLLLNNLNAIKR